MEEAGVLLASVFDGLAMQVQPMITTLDLDDWIEQQLCQRGLVSKTKGYRGYKHVSCISVNDEVVHGVPNEKKVLSAGDMVKVDICAAWNGYCADMTRVFFVGQASAVARDLVAVAYAALDKGIAQAYPGNHLSDISAAIQQEVERHGFGVIRDFAGHGIGKCMHEEPEVLNYGSPGKGPLLQPGMALAIELMITLGDYNVYVTDDGWTVKTIDKGLAAHVEDTIVITDKGPKILTRPVTHERKAL